MISYLDSLVKADCTGCWACVNVCPKGAITMVADSEGFYYPEIDKIRCTECGLCSRICTDFSTEDLKNDFQQRAFGGSICDEKVLADSTSGGAFSAIASAYGHGKSAIFGVEAVNVYEARHAYVTDVDEVHRFRGSKYSQSCVGNSYKDALFLLNKNYKVLFSGTPCQIGGLRRYLRNKDYDNLLTVEVVCEGVPSPLFIKKQLDAVQRKHFSGKRLTGMAYRYKDGNRWDYEVMAYTDGNKIRRIDRWFNPFWSVWLQHLMSRPSCYVCDYATKGRVADITLGDLWGVHLYCPDLYNDNRGASLIVCNTEKGLKVFEEARENMLSRELEFKEALKYQGPMRRTIRTNPARETFMNDLLGLSYEQLCKKWAKPSSFRLLISKYIYGTNKQKCRKYRRKRKGGRQ